MLAVARGEGAAQIFDLEQKKPVAPLESPDGRGGYLAISPDGTVIVQGARDGVRMWRLPARTADSN